MFRSVTLLVTPEEAERLQLACTSGRPRLVLRGNGDYSPAKTSGATLADLRGAAPVKPLITPTVTTIELSRRSMSGSPMLWGRTPPPRSACPCAVSSNATTTIPRSNCHPCSKSGGIDRNDRCFRLPSYFLSIRHATSRPYPFKPAPGLPHGPPRHQLGGDIGRWRRVSPRSS